MRLEEHTRRGFLKRMTAAGLALPFSGTSLFAASARDSYQGPQDTRTLCVFSKHLQFLDYEPMAEAAAEAGFGGVDFTVRPGGHVLPENVERDLPRAVKAVRDAGLETPMMTTAIARVDDPHAETILKTAADLGIRYYRMDWVDYDENLGIAESLAAYRPHLERLVEMNKALGLHGAYQNHAGTSIGAPVWDLHLLLEGLDPEHIGVQYDIRHATVEGANSWPLGMQLLHPYIKTTVIKDFAWAQEEGTWRVENVPIGEGVVEFEKYYRMISDFGISGPISMHFEYAMPGEHDDLNLTERTRRTIAVMSRDLGVLRGYLSEAGLRPD